MARPTAPAMTRTCRIRSSNSRGVSDCCPSESAFSGQGWTSMMSPSAPAAIAARAIAATWARRPMPCDGSTTTGRCVSDFRTGTAFRSSVLRVIVSKVRMPALAERHLVVAARDDVLGGHEPLLDGGGRAALQQHRLADLPELLQEREVLHVARADLEDVGVLGDHRERLDVHHLGHDLEARLLARQGEQLEALLGEPLELVGAGARLVGAAAEEARAGGASPRAPPRAPAPSTRPSTGRP